MEYLSSLHVSVRHICLCTQGNTVEYNFIFFFTAGCEKGKKKKKQELCCHRQTSLSPSGH